MAHALVRLYKHILKLSTPVIDRALEKRLAAGKEDPHRIAERRGIPSRSRPEGKLIWIHVASVGEAQSIRIMIDELLAANKDLHILVTSITRTSADLLTRTLPDRAFHQYAPFDHPDWVRAFFDHWQPTMVLWVESELWPSMLHNIQKNHIPSALLNARMSKKSSRNWGLAKSMLRDLLTAFDVILCQTDDDKNTYESLGAQRVVTTGNIKYSAEPLSYNEIDYQNFKATIQNRPTWIYASTHDGEEEIAARIHRDLKTEIPNLLTFIAPRHPERTEKIIDDLATYNITIMRRSESSSPPARDTDIYLIDTMGELGLFYKLSNIAMIGRSLSHDGGGGHNPLEAMRADCVVIHGHNVQNLSDIYNEINEEQAGITVTSADELREVLKKLFTDTQAHKILLSNTKNFITARNEILHNTLDELEPFFLKIGITPPRSHINKLEARK